ncbi:MAG: ribonuclease P protein component [Thermomicrobiales bacterium]|nr:ribonuclease P protein component [Thermomicrobiales bacterium]MCA9880345.1 ribonuclease P protein component [Thermomicrobiales bacterium]
MERDLRLRRERDVRVARARGRSVTHGPYVLRYLRNPASPDANRYTVVAGKKVGGSVQRNRLKRVTREALRALHPRLATGFDCVIILRGTVEELPSSAAAFELLTVVFQRAGMLPQAAPAGEPGS